MLKTIESEVSRQAAPPALQAEFAQHDFERPRTFCSLTYIVSVVIWLMFDVIVSTKGGQGFTGLSLLIVGTLIILTIPISMPELGRLITLRDALLLLKVPLANSCGLQGMVESQLLSNDVHDRVLGKLKANTTDPALTSA